MSNQSAVQFIECWWLDDPFRLTIFILRLDAFLIDLNPSQWEYVHFYFNSCRPQKANSQDTAFWGQAMYSLHCKRNLQQENLKFVAESATFLLFFDLLSCFWFHKHVPKSLYRLKLLHKWAILWNLQLYLMNPQTNDKTFVSLNWVVAESATVSGIRNMEVESANCKWIP